VNLGHCAFKDCKKWSGTCPSHNGEKLLLCREHWQYLSDLHTEDIIESAFRMVAESQNKEESNVQVHSPSIQ
jgi:hypothetical protein